MAKETKVPRPPSTKAIRAKCLDCICWSHNGRLDCEISACSLYYWMPFRGMEPDMDWLENRKWARRPGDKIDGESVVANIDGDTGNENLSEG